MQSRITQKRSKPAHAPKPEHIPAYMSMIAEGSKFMRAMKMHTDAPVTLADQEMYEKVCNETRCG